MFFFLPYLGVLNLDGARRKAIVCSPILGNGLEKGGTVHGVADKHVAEACIPRNRCIRVVHDLGDLLSSTGYLLSERRRLMPPGEEGKTNQSDGMQLCPKNMWIFSQI